MLNDDDNGRGGGRSERLLNAADAHVNASRYDSEPVSSRSLPAYADGGMNGHTNGTKNTNGNGTNGHSLIITAKKHADDEMGFPAAVKDDSGEDKEYIQYPIRWFILLLFVLTQIVNGMLWITFSPIQPNASAYYGVSSTGINMLSIVAMITYLPASVAAAWVFERYGIKTGMLISAGCGAVCGWLRYFSSTHDDEPIANGYYLVLCGQIIGGIGQPFSMNAPAMIAANWFSVSQRDVATTIAAMSMPLGIAVGQLLPGFFVTDGSGANAKGLPMLMLCEALIASGVLLVMLLFRSKPPTPPSRSQEQQEKQSERENGGDARAAMSTSKLMDGMRALVRNRNFMILNVAVTFGVAFINSFAALTDQIIAPCGYSTTDAGHFGALTIGAGLVGSAVFGPIMDATHAYNKILKVLLFCFAASTWFVYAMLREDNKTWLTIAFASLGFFMMPLLPVGMACGIECSFPVEPDLSTAFLMNFGNIPGVGLTIGMGDLLSGAKCTMFNAASITFLVLNGLMFLTALFYNGGTHRLHAEHAKLLSDQHVACEGPDTVDVEDRAPSSSRSS